MFYTSPTSLFFLYFFYLALLSTLLLPRFSFYISSTLSDRIEYQKKIKKIYLLLPCNGTFFYNNHKDCLGALLPHIRIHTKGYSLLHLYFHMIYIDFRRKLSLFASLFTVSILIPFFLHPNLISPVEGERWRGSFPPFEGEEVIFTSKVEKWKSFFLHSPSFLLHSSSFILHYPFFVFLYLLFWRHIFYYFRVDF